MSNDQTNESHEQIARMREHIRELEDALAASRTARVEGLLTPHTDRETELLSVVDRTGRLFTTLAGLVSEGLFDAARSMIDDLQQRRSGIKLETDGDLVRATGWCVTTVLDAMRTHLEASKVRHSATWSFTYPDGFQIELFAQRVEGVPLARRLSVLEHAIAAVRAEKAERAAWLASLPDGSCGNPPPAALLDAEAHADAALAHLEALGAPVKVGG